MQRANGELILIAKRTSPFAAMPRTMNRDTSDSFAEPVELSAMLDEMEEELRCLLGPKIQLATGSLPAGGTAFARARHADVVDVLRHLALDAHDAMPAGGTVTLHAGCLPDVPEYAAIVIHEVPGECAIHEENEGARIHKGRSLGLGATYDMIRRAGGHFHVSCRSRDTVLTICFPLADE